MLSLCAVNEVMPGRRSVFENWAGYCSVEMQKLFIWNSCSLKLLQEIESFGRLEFEETESRGSCVLDVYTIF